MRNKLLPARLCTLRLPRHSARPPLMSLSGYNANQDTKRSAVFHLDIAPHFTEQGEHHRQQPGNLCQVHSKQFVGLRSQIETGFRIGVLLLASSLFLLPVRRHWLLFGVHPGLERYQQLLDLFIASRNLLLVMLVHLGRLLQREKVLRPPSAHQRLANRSLHPRSGGQSFVRAEK
jgi:hypothetical protein